MLEPFHTLSDSSKVWIYQSSRKFSEAETTQILEDASNFVATWTAHQAGLKAGVELLHHCFLIIAVDETYNDASGCSIDKKVNFIKQLELKYNTSFFDRMLVAGMDDAGSVVLVQLSELDAKLQSGILNLDSMVFNNLVASMGEFKSGWKVKLKDSWMMNFVSNKVH